MTNDNGLNLDMDDEIIAGATYTHDGNITHEDTKDILKDQ
jgi:hypothetical protein